MGNLTLEELKSKIEMGKIDSVVLAFPDHLGQLMGKCLTGEYFLEKNQTNCCDYLLTINIKQEPLQGFKLSGWDKGYGDFVMIPDFSTIREITWQKQTVMIICDLVDGDGNFVNIAPRSILQKQCKRLLSKNMEAIMASELEFFLFDNTYESIHKEGLTCLTPSSHYSIDYNILHTGFNNDFLREICNKISLSGIPIESRKGEAGKGQYEIGLKYTSPIAMADSHMVYKNGAKSIAEANGKSITFMAKYSDSDAGSSCHIHISILEKETGHNLFIENGQESSLFKYFLGGLNALASEFFIFFAPTINSYKRFSCDSFAPTKISWGYDNRTTSFRIVGENKGFRIENRLPGADANPYLAFAATIAAGLYGVENKIEPPSILKGNQYLIDKLPKVPGTLKEAAENLNNSKIARDVFGDDVVEHYVRHARLEIESYEKQVSQWEFERYFERI
ncbi:MAG: glutamine synthetase family protein [Spirochaetaceae bacterium]|jgi:glutamine synthetase|nr:glutamine synthetase family protein [Spirochaetaceae bacterium]